MREHRQRQRRRGGFGAPAAGHGAPDPGNSILLSLGTFGDLVIHRLQQLLSERELLVHGRDNPSQMKMDAVTSPRTQWYLAILPNAEGENESTPAFSSLPSSPPA